MIRANRTGEKTESGLNLGGILIESITSVQESRVSKSASFACAQLNEVAGLSMLYLVNQLREF